MKTLIKVLGLMIFGGATGWLVWFALYERYKGTIEFNGPALGLMILSTIAGGVLLALVGLFIIKSKARRL